MNSIALKITFQIDVWTLKNGHMKGVGRTSMMRRGAAGTTSRSAATIFVVAIELIN
jgi:hypothetical protein